MKPLIVGEAPSKNQDPERPIEGRIGMRLAACCGLPYDQFLDHFERVNLLHVRQDTAAKGFEFDAVAGALAAKRIWCLDTSPDRIILLLGKRVATAFGAHDRWFELQRLGSLGEFYVLPHPSGVNRWWNDPANEERAVRFMHEVVERTR